MPGDGQTAQYEFCQPKTKAGFRKIPMIKKVYDVLVLQQKMILQLIIRQEKDLKIWYLLLRQTILSIRQILKIPSIILWTESIEKIRISFLNT